MKKSANLDTLYKIIEFKEKVKSGQKIIECVPSTWITYDHKIGSCVVKYMAPPYSPEDLKLIQDLIRIRALPPEDWLQFPIELRGDSNSYKEGVKKLSILDKQLYTTDSEERGIEKARKTTEMIKSKINVEKMLSNNNKSSSELSSSEDASSSEDDSNKKWKRKLKRDSDKTCTTNYKPKLTATTRLSKLTRGKQNEMADNPSTNETIKDQASQVIVIPDELNMESNKEVLEMISTDASLKNITKPLTYIYVGIKKLTIEVNSMKNDLQALRNAIERSTLVRSNKISIPIFVEKYNFTKIRSTTEFNKFDLELQTNEEFAKDFKDVLENLIDSNMKQSINATVKKFLHRDFAMNCTAIRASNYKFVLKDTYFYNFLFDFICRYHKDSDGRTITEKIFYQSLSSCLTNAKDWDGHRKFRQPAIIQDKT